MKLLCLLKAVGFQHRDYYTYSIVTKDSLTNSHKSNICITKIYNSQKNIAHKILQEWEVYVLAKLNWNVPGLVATDFVDHILKVGAVFLLVYSMNVCLLIGSIAVTCL